MTDSERIKKLEEIIQEQTAMLARVVPVIDALGELLVRRSTVNERMKLNKNTLTQNRNIDKFEALGQSGIMIEIKDVKKIRKRSKK